MLGQSKNSALPWQISRANKMRYIVWGFHSSTTESGSGKKTNVGSQLNKLSQKKRTSSGMGSWRRMWWGFEKCSRSHQSHYVATVALNITIRKLVEVILRDFYVWSLGGCLFSVLQNWIVNAILHLRCNSYRKRLLYSRALFFFQGHQIYKRAIKHWQTEVSDCIPRWRQHLSFLLSPLSLR